MKYFGPEMLMEMDGKWMRMGKLAFNG